MRGAGALPRDQVGCRRVHHGGHRPGEVEDEDDVDALLLLVLAAQDALRSPESEHGEHERRAPRALPGASRSGVRQPRGPSTSGAMVGRPSRGTRASAPSVILQTMYGTASSAAHERDAPRRRARARRACRPSTDAARAGPARRSTSRPATPRRGRAPGQTRASARTASVDSATSAPRTSAPSARSRPRLRARGDRRRADARPRRHRRPHHALGLHERALALLERRRHVANFTRSHCCRNPATSGIGSPKCGSAPQRREGLVGRRLEPVEAEAGAEVFADGVVDPIEEVREALPSRADRRDGPRRALEGDLPGHARRRRRRDRLRTPAASGSTSQATSDPTTPHRATSHARPRSSATHSSRCTPRRRVGRGCAFGVDAVGSSTTIVCGFVQSVTTSLLARAIATGSGGSVSVWRPGSLGRATSGRSSVVWRRPLLASTSALDRRAAPPPSLIGEREARALERSRGVALALQLEPAGQHRLALPVGYDRRAASRRSRSSRAPGTCRPASAARRPQARSRRTRPARRTPRGESSREAPAAGGGRVSSSPDPPGAASEEVTQRTDEGAAGLDFDRVEAQLVKRRSPALGDLPHRGRVPRADARVARVDDDALAALEVLEASRAPRRAARRRADRASTTGTTSCFADASASARSYAVS